MSLLVTRGGRLQRVGQSRKREGLAQLPWRRRSEFQDASALEGVSEGETVGWTDLAQWSRRPLEVNPTQRSMRERVLVVLALFKTHRQFRDIVRLHHRVLRMEHLLQEPNSHVSAEPACGEREREREGHPAIVWLLEISPAWQAVVKSS
jgi:hypothetical protein